MVVRETRVFPAGFLRRGFLFRGARYFLQQLPGQHLPLAQQSAAGVAALAVPSTSSAARMVKRYFIRYSC